MRFSRTLATTSLLLFVGLGARAETARDLAPSADELLELWNRDDFAESPTTLTPEQLGGDDASAEFDLRTYSSPSYTRPSGGSLTPNIDRLMSKSNNPNPGTACDPYRPRRPRPNPPDCPGGGGHGGDHDDGHDDGHGDGGCEPVPEPGTILLFGAAAGIAGLRKRFSRKQVD